SPLPRRHGLMQSRASSPNSPDGVSSAAYSGRSTTSRPPSIASSPRPTIRNPSSGPQSQPASSPLSNEGSKRWSRSTSVDEESHVGQEIVQKLRAKENFFSKKKTTGWKP